MVSIQTQFAMGQFDLMEQVGQQVEAIRKAQIESDHQTHRGAMASINKWMVGLQESYTDFEENASFIEYLAAGAIWTDSIDGEIEAGGCGELCFGALDVLAPW